jgi:hypothetical protein
MGSNSMRVYVGPFVCCTPKKRKVEVTINGYCLGCFPDTKYLTKSDSTTKKFCSECGNRLQDLVVLQPKIPSQWEVYSKLNEALAPFNGEHAEYIEHLYVPNQLRGRSEGFRTLFFDTPDVFETIQPVHVEMEPDWLRLNYEEEVQALKNFYGDANVEIKFGVITKYD